MYCKNKSLFKDTFHKSVLEDTKGFYVKTFSTRKDIKNYYCVLKKTLILEFNSEISNNKKIFSSFYDNRFFCVQTIFSNIMQFYLKSMFSSITYENRVNVSRFDGCF